MGDGPDPIGDGEVGDAVATPTEHPEGAGGGAGPPAAKHSHRRLRTVSSWVLVVLACLLAVLSVVTIYAKEELLNTDAYVSTVAPLASNPAIQNRVATLVSEQLVEQTDLPQRIKEALPPRASFLAAPLAGQVQNLVHSVTLKFVQSPAFAKLWTALNRKAHAEEVALLTGSTQGALSSSSGTVTVNLGKVGEAVRADLLKRGVTVVNKVPNLHPPTLVLFKSTALVKAQRATRLLIKLAVLLPVLAVLLLAASIGVANDRRRGLVRAALGLALSMAVVLVAIGLGRNWYLSTFADPERKAAAEAVLAALSTVLVDTLRTVLLVAFVIGAVAWLVGTAPVRRWMTNRRLPAWLVSSPVHTFSVRHRRALQWGTLALGLVLLVVWSNPTALVAVVIVLVALAVVGLIGVYARLPDPGPPPATTG